MGRACEEAERRDKFNDVTLKLHKRRLEAEFSRVMALAPDHPAGVKWKSTIEKLYPAKRHADIRSVIESARRQSTRPLQAIRDVINPPTTLPSP